LRRDRKSIRLSGQRREERRREEISKLWKRKREKNTRK